MSEELKAFEEWKIEKLGREGLSDCPRPITYGTGDLYEAFLAGQRAGMERSAEIAEKKPFASHFHIRKELDND